MASKTIRISKGNQYDQDGFYIEIKGSTLYAFGAVEPRMDGTTGLSWGGTYLPAGADREAIEAAIAEVLATGKSRTIRVGRDEPVEAVAPSWRSPRGLTLAEEMDSEDSDY